MDMSGGLCFDCNTIARSDLQEVQLQADRLKDAEEKETSSAIDRILLTTEAAPNLRIVERLDIITAECVFGMHLLKDLLAIGRDAFGGRSGTLQDTLREARRTVLRELRAEAYRLGADAVIAVDLDYSEISGGGKSMLFLVASGTAVRLETVNQD